MKFWSLKYRLFLRLRRYFRLRDALQLLMAAAAGALTINTLATSPEVTTAAGITYGLAWLSFVYVTIRQRRARDFLQGEILWGLFNQLNEDVFGGDHRTRFTLFQRAPLRPKELIAMYRYKRGGRSAIAEAEESLMHFDDTAGMVGLACSRAGDDVFFRPIRPFETRMDCVAWHVDQLCIRKDVADHFSPYMEQVQGIFSYGFVDSQTHILGVLSLDLCAPVTRQTIHQEDGTKTHVLSFPSSYGDRPPIVIDTEIMKRILKSTQTVLQSFSAGRRVDHGST